MSSRPVSFPGRPTLPPLFVAASSAWISIACAEEISWRIYVEEIDVAHAAIVIGIVASLIAVALFAMHRLRRSDERRWVVACVRHPLAIAAIVACIGSICGLMCWASWTHDVELLSDLFADEGSAEVSLTGDPTERDYGIVSTGSIDIGCHTIDVRLIWPIDAEASFAGHAVEVTGSVLSPQADDAGRWSHQNGCAGTIKASSAQEAGYSDSPQGIVARFRDDSFSVIEEQPGDSAGLLAGILLGNRTLYAGTELELAFQTTGLAHLMAVSGTHLAIVTMLIALVLGKLPLKRICRVALLVAAIGLYVALTGFAPSALRAFAMCGVAMGVGMLERRPDTISSLALCVFAFICVDPTIIYAVGFQLSVLAVFGLVLFGSLLSSWVRESIPFLPESLASSIGATLAASFATLPVTIPLFAQLPLVSPVANLLVAPLVTVTLGAGMLGIVANAVIAPLGTVLLELASAIANIAATLVRLLADVPGACLPVSSGSSLLSIVFAIIFIALWVIWPQPAGRIDGHDSACLIGTAARTAKVACCLAIPLIVAAFIGFGQYQLAHTPSSTRVVMLDVGQGDSILIQSGDAAALVDTGEKSDVLIRELAEKGVSHLDAIFISHKDADHAGALGKLAGIVDIDHVYVHEDLLGKEVARAVLESAAWATAGKGAEGVSPGFEARLGEFTLSVVAPKHGGASENDDSLVILVEYDAEGDGAVEARGILTGDAEKDAMKDVVSQVGDVDFLKVAHHGSKGGLSDEQLKALSPEIALISVGAQNKYGHPTAETLRMLADAHARIYRTDEQGAVSVFFTKEGMAIETER